MAFLRGRVGGCLAAGAVVLALSSWQQLTEALERWPTPLGVFPVGIVVALVIYYVVERTRRRLTVGVESRPMRPDPVPTAPVGIQKALEAAKAAAGPTSPPRGRRASLPSAPEPEGRPGDLPVLAAQAAPMPARRGYSGYAVPSPAAAPAGGALLAKQPKPGVMGFGWRVALAYAAIAVPLLGFSPYFLARAASLWYGTPFPSPAPPTVPYFFSLYDRLVQGLGTLLFWPQPWPGPARFLQGPYVFVHTAADFIFTMYLVLMIAFLIASGVIGGGGFSRSQRLRAAAVVLGYVVTALFTEVFFFTIHPSLFYSSLALLGRSFLGGLFFSFLLFAILVAPPVMVVPRWFDRRRKDLAVFFGTAAASLTLGFLLLYVLWQYLGIGVSATVLGFGGPTGYVLEPFALLLLLPIIALTIWALIGRALYARELRLRPMAPLALFHPPVSVLVPAYNEEATISGTIRAIDQAARLYPGTVEIVIGNDGSSDRTSLFANEAMRRLHYSYGRVVDLPHGGKSSALNGALRSCRGDVVIRVDADTRISPQYGFAAMVTPFSDPEVGGVQGLLLPLQQEGWTRKLRMLELVWNHLFLRRATYGTRTAQVVDGAFCAFRRRDMLAVGGWVPWNGEDTEITYRLQRIGFRMRYETRAVAYEDVPANYKQLKKQRIRWTRGGYFAHHRHAASLFSEAPEFGGLAMLLWLALFVRGGMRHLVYIYAALMTILLGLQTFIHIAIVVALLLIPRGLVMAYYLIRLRAYGYLPWILTWPFTSAVKQFIAMEGYGTILPGAIPEFSE